MIIIIILITIIMITTQPPYPGAGARPGAATIITNINILAIFYPPLK